MGTHFVQNHSSILADLASMLLSNLSASATVCASLLSMTISVLPDTQAPSGYYPPQSRSGTCLTPVPYPSGEPREIHALPLLLDAFVQAAAAAESGDTTTQKRKGELHFISSVFANTSTVSFIRLVSYRMHLHQDD